MERVPRLSRRKRRSLVRAGRRTGDPATAIRFLIVAQLGGGRGVVEVARMLHVAVSTVSKTAARYLESGVEALVDRRRSNGAAKADEPFRRQVVELLRQSPPDHGWERPTWTRELLCMQMARDGAPRVSVCTMGRVLAAIGARLGVPKPIVLCPWSRDDRVRVLAKIRRLEASACGSEPVYYSDEVDIHLNPKIGRDWMLPGHQRRVVTPGKNQKFYLAGALNAVTGALVCVGEAAKNSFLFCQLLRQLAKLHKSARRVHLIVDNYAIHSSKQTLRVLRDLGGKIVLHFLPPYCPDANRIERVWQELHANVTRNHRCKTLNKLLTHVKYFVDCYAWRVAVKPSLRRAA
jgi:transposase